MRRDTLLMITWVASVLVFFVSTGQLTAQTSQPDSLLKMPWAGRMSQTPDSANFPSPGSVMLRSAVLPGWGQWVNGQKIKSILALGGEIGLLSNAIYLNQKAVAATDPDEKAFYEDNRGLNVWLALGLYFLNLLDAYVDAQLADFDVGPNLTYTQIGPARGVWMLSFEWDL